MTRILGARPAGRAMARLGLILLLLGVFAVGLRRPELAGPEQTVPWAAPDVTGGSSGSITWSLLVTGVLLLVLVVLLVWRRARRRRRRPEDEYVPYQVPVPWTAKAMALVVLLVVIAAVVVAVWYALRLPTAPMPAEPPVGTVPEPPYPGTGAESGPSGGGSPGWLVGAIVAGSSLLVIAAGRAILTYRRARPETPPDTTPAPAVSTAVAAGRSALREPVDDREAIIACYSAMERELDQRGTHREPAQTPAELVENAAAAGQVNSAAAGELLDLFHRARHSSHPVGPEQRRAAEHTLATLALDLEVRT